MSHLPWPLIWLCLTALVAGAINSVAGGGTLLTFPALVAALSGRSTGFTGLARGHIEVFANATSTVALVPGSLSGAWGYRRAMKGMRPWLLLLAIPSFLGGGVGSSLVILYPKYFSVLVPWLLLTAALLFLKESLFPRQAGPRAADDSPSAKARALLVCAQFCIAVYGGYFGAGIGILMLSSLTLMRAGNIHQMNALKTLLATCINSVSLVVFVFSGKVHWEYALPMAVFGIVGGYVGARTSLRIPPRYVRWFVVAIGFGLAAYFFSTGRGR